MFPIMRLLPLEETHLKLGYEASPGNCGIAAVARLGRLASRQPSVAPSLTTLPSAPLTPAALASWVFSSTLGLFPCPLCLGCPSWTGISVAHSGAPSALCSNKVLAQQALLYPKSPPQPQPCLLHLPPSDILLTLLSVSTRQSPLGKV